MFVTVGDVEYEVRSNGGASYTIIDPSGTQHSVRSNAIEFPFETVINEILHLSGNNLDALTSIQFKDYDLRPTSQSPGPWAWDQNDLIY